METLLDLFVNIDAHLKTLILDYGAWTYLVLFVIILLETGLVVMPFLPGDSLLFAAGALAALGDLHVLWLIGLLILAAVLGDTVNYLLGAYFGRRALEGRIPMIRRDHLLRTQDFYNRYGAKTIILARFVPVVRTFAPFVAGFGRMLYRSFVIYNIIGGILWVSLFVLGGYFLGSMKFIRRNFGLAVAVIVIVSVFPALIELVKGRLAAAKKSLLDAADGEAGGP